MTVNSKFLDNEIANTLVDLDTNIRNSFGNLAVPGTSPVAIRSPRVSYQWLVIFEFFSILELTSPK